MEYALVQGAVFVAYKDQSIKTVYIRSEDDYKFLVQNNIPIEEIEYSLSAIEYTFTRPTLCPVDETQMALLLMRFEIS